MSFMHRERKESEGSPSRAERIEIGVDLQLDEDVDEEETRNDVGELL